jgi:hypothetical protein
MLAQADDNTENVDLTIEPQASSIVADGAGCEVELVESQS